MNTTAVGCYSFAVVTKALDRLMRQLLLFSGRAVFLRLDHEKPATALTFTGYTDHLDTLSSFRPTHTTGILHYFRLRHCCSQPAYQCRSTDTEQAVKIRPYATRIENKRGRQLHYPVEHKGALEVCCLLAMTDCCCRQREVGPF